MVFFKTRLFKALAAFVLLLAMAGCGNKTVTRNIRVIVQAEVAGEIVEGSAIMGIRWQSDGKEHGAMRIKMNTEAVSLDLGDRGTVYILNAYMTDDGLSNGSYWPLQILRSFGMRANGKLSNFPELKSLQGRYPVRAVVGSPKTLPVMVSLKDEAKLETMFEVKPADFPKFFGNDVRYVGMWFEFTDDEPTETLPVRLPVALKPNDSFYDAFPDRDAAGKRIPSAERPFPEKISKNMFFRKGY